MYQDVFLLKDGALFILMKVAHFRVSKPTTMRCHPVKPSGFLLALYTNEWSKNN